MEWFDEFIEETRELWQEQKDEKIEELMEEITSILEELTSKQKGDIGEDLVEHLLKNRVFHTVITERSQTPSDVSGIRIYKNYIHIVLIQVKTAKKQAQPQPLSDDKIMHLRVFTKFVLDRFKISEIVPDKFKAKNILISNGYVGVKINDKGTEITSSEAYTFWMPTKLADFKNLTKELVRATHKF